MNSETPPTISMALVNPQMPSVSADSRNSSTQQLSISVWVEHVIRKSSGMFSEKGADMHHEGLVKVWILHVFSQVCRLVLL